MIMSIKINDLLQVDLEVIYRNTQKKISFFWKISGLKSNEKNSLTESSLVKVNHKIECTLRSLNGVEKPHKSSILETKRFEIYSDDGLFLKSILLVDTEKFKTQFRIMHTSRGKYIRFIDEKRVIPPPPLKKGKNRIL